MYRVNFNLSSEHPVIGYFDLSIKHKDFFQKYLKHKMNFDKHEYGLWGGQ
ncbi:DUF7683 domain-containing protein [Pseudoneobacillus rhizosphaerae]